MGLTLFLVRHGATGLPPGTLLGRTEADLSAEGRHQARALAGLVPPDCACLLSPLARCRQTLEGMRQGGFRGSSSVDERLREMDFGHWEARRFDELDPSPDQIAALSRYHGFVFPGGESVDGFIARLRAVTDELRARAGQGGERLLLLTHGGVIRTLVCLLLGLDARHYLLFSIDPGSVTTIDLHPEGGILTGLNHRP